MSLRQRDPAPLRKDDPTVQTSATDVVRAQRSLRKWHKLEITTALASARETPSTKGVAASTDILEETS